MKKRIYISGKMGEKMLSAETIAKFQRAEDRLKSEGWEDVVNPASAAYQSDAHKCIKGVVSNSGVEIDWYSEFLLYDLHKIATCDAIFMLPDWSSSPGARTELCFARACKKEVII